MTLRMVNVAEDSERAPLGPAEELLRQVRKERLGCPLLGSGPLARRLRVGKRIIVEAGRACREAPDEERYQAQEAPAGLEVGSREKSGGGSGAELVLLGLANGRALFLVQAIFPRLPRPGRAGGEEKGRCIR